MPGPLQFEAPTALEYFSSLVAEDATLSLTEAALSLAQDDNPGLDTQAVLFEIDSLADRIKRRLSHDAAPVQKLRLLNRYFFQELGFAGNVNDYYDVRNSYVDAVIETRRGIPITLAVIYIEIASQIGLTAKGVSFPGHFLVKLRMPQGEVVIDPFTGHSLSRHELDELLLPYRRAQGLDGDFDVPLGLFLQASPPRDVLARMLRNLKEIHRGARDWPRLLAVQQRLVVLLPQAWEELRDRGLAHMELGQTEQAIDDLTMYLERARGATDRRAISRQLSTLKGMDPRRLH